MQLSHQLINNLFSMSSFFSPIVGLFAACIMILVIKKFGSGIIAEGFRFVAIGVVLIAIAMFLDALILSYDLSMFSISVGFVRLIKEVLLIAGMYTIVIGAKTTADKLENLQKSKN